jgi:hypothetical protein
MPAVCQIKLNGSKFVKSSWTNSALIVSEESINNYLEIYEKFKDNKLKDNTTVYLTPISLMPSYKLKNYFEENKLNINTARKFEKLDSLIISDQFIRDFYIPKEYKKEITTYRIIPYDVIANKFNKYINKQNRWSDIRYSNYHTEAKFDFYYIDEEEILIQTKIDPNFGELLKYPSITGRLITSQWGTKKAIDSYEFFENLKNITNKHDLDIVFDSNINSEINKETVIDLEIFQTLYSMLSSNDQDNWNIAREIIANSEFEQSKPYVLFLANVFPSLQNKSNNRNYHLIHKAISEYKFVREYDYNIFIQKFVEKYPQYSQITCDCLVVHINHLCKTSLIKEIHSLF